MATATKAQGASAARAPALRLKAPVEPDPLENWHQETLFRTAELHQREHPELLEMYAVPNGGWRHKATAAAMQRQGVRPGVPDIALDVPRRGFHGIRIELKRFRTGRMEEEQKKRLARLQERGYRAVVCWGWRAAWEELLWYLGAEPERTATAYTSFSPYVERRGPSRRPQPAPAP